MHSSCLVPDLGSFAICSAFSVMAYRHKTDVKSQDLEKLLSSWYQGSF